VRTGVAHGFSYLGSNRDEMVMQLGPEMVDMRWTVTLAGLDRPGEVGAA
jgi:hypothetical protein